MSDYPNIAAAILTRDSAESVERAIVSAARFCSQIVAVDTGSRDGTPEILSRLGAETHYFEWRDDFAAARNYSLKFLRADWALVLDSDEELDESSMRENLGLFDDPGLGGINVLLENALAQGAKTRHRYTRLFRLLPGIKFEGRIHEQVRPSIEAAGMRIVESSILIRHYGYENVTPEKIARNIELLERELDEAPTDDWLKYHLATTAHSAGDAKRAEPLLREIINSARLTRTQIETARIKLAQILLASDDYAAVPEALNFTSGDADLEGLRISVLAAAALCMGDVASARALYASKALDASASVDKNAIETARKILQIR
ncbi:MAG: glycosyltransferase [Chloroflexota bacterium]